MGVSGHLGLVVVRDGVDGLSELARIVGGDAEDEGVSCHDQLGVTGVPNSSVCQSDGEGDVVLRPVELKARGRGHLKDTRGKGTVILCRVNSYLGSKSLRCVEGG